MTAPTLDRDRFTAAWWGGFIGDALAMPVHWYYSRERIPQDYGDITGYLPPHNPHPDSFLPRSHYTSSGPEDDILHEQARWWGGPAGIHYHQFLHAGENTLNLRLAAVLADSLIECGRYDRDDYASRYADFMLTPGMHGDTYVEECHRTFFHNYGRGLEFADCGSEDSNIGGLSTLAPLILFHVNDRDALLQAVTDHAGLTHKGADTAAAAVLYADIVFHLLHGASIDEALARAEPAGHPALTPPYREWSDTLPDETVVGERYAIACPLRDALPATLFLAVKYAGAPRDGLLSNVRLGGDNCHRGAVLGTLLGAASGMDALPPDWLGGLYAHRVLNGQLAALRALVSGD